MKSMVLVATGTMELRDVPRPLIRSADDVLIRMSRVGVCGSDIHYYKTGRIGDQVVHFPFVLGHEGAGIVEEADADVTGLKAGDRVAIDPAMPCWTCDQCLAGRFHTCRKLRFLGCPGQAEGCLSEYIIMPASSCYTIPDTMTMDQAALTEPLSIGLHAARLAPPLIHSTVGILGYGPIGMSVALMARQLGAARIYVTDKIPARLLIASANGATWTGNPLNTNVVNEVLGMEPSMLDVVFECCGQQEAIDQAVDLLKPGGTLLILGIGGNDTVQFPSHVMRRKELTIRNVRRQCDCVEETIDLISKGIINATVMISHRFPLSLTSDAFDLVMDYRDGVMKAMIDLW